MIFATPSFLWLLLVIPVLVGYLFIFRAGDIPGFQFSSNELVAKNSRQLTKDPGVMSIGLLRVLALTLIIVGLARPQKGLQIEELTTKAIDIIICLDDSSSMLCIDINHDKRFIVAMNGISKSIQGR